MLARDIMTTDVCTADPETSVAEIARLIVDRNISAVVVVDDDRRILGLVSEGDVMRRSETGTDKKRSSWRRFVADHDALAKDYRRSHALKAHAIMSRRIVCADETTPLDAIADIFETNSIKRVPIVRDGRLVGIVSRKDLVRAFVSESAAHSAPATAGDDESIRKELERRMESEPWAGSVYLQTVVRDGIVEFFGFVRSKEHKLALATLAETVPGVKGVKCEVHVGSLPYGV